MGSVTQSLLTWGWNGTNNPEKKKKKFERSYASSAANLKSVQAHTDYKLWEIFTYPAWNESVSLNSCPMSMSQKYTLENDLPCWEFQQRHKRKKGPQKSTAFEPPKHITEEQHGRTDIHDGPQEGNEVGMGLHNCFSCSRPQIMSYKPLWIYLHTLCSQRRCLN